MRLDHDVGCARSPRFVNAIVLLARPYDVDFDGAVLKTNSSPGQVVRRMRDLLEAILAVNAMV